MPIPSMTLTKGRSNIGGKIGGKNGEEKSKDQTEAVRVSSERRKKAWRMKKSVREET